MNDTDTPAYATATGRASSHASTRCERERATRTPAPPAPADASDTDASGDRDTNTRQASRNRNRTLNLLEHHEPKHTTHGGHQAQHSTKRAAHRERRREDQHDSDQRMKPSTAQRRGCQRHKRRRRQPNQQPDDPASKAGSGRTSLCHAAENLASPANTGRNRQPRAENPHTTGAIGAANRGQNRGFSARPLGKRAAPTSSAGTWQPTVRTVRTPRATALRPDGGSRGLGGYVLVRPG